MNSSKTQSAADVFPLAAPKVIPPLDLEFRPAVLANRAFRQQLEQVEQPRTVRLALEQADGSMFHWETNVFPTDHPRADANYPYLERMLKFLLWSRGGYRIHISGPDELADQLKRHYRDDPTGQFDSQIIGERIYDRPLELVYVNDYEIPSAKADTRRLGRHWEGCRIGFDLGASDRKVAAVEEGKTVFSEELVWDPVPQSDPQWHYEQITEALRLAASHLPRVDAIGGSSAGVYVNNRVKVASLFRGVPADLFESRVKDLFLEIKKAWADIPFEVVNDGEVTALAGSMALGQNGVLGLALGSSLAAGYVAPEGTLTTWLNELAFAPVDYRPQAPVDEWSGDYGCGVQYLSQQCVGRLLPLSGIETDPNLPLPEKLKHVQSRMQAGDKGALKIYQTIGTYLGYAVAHYADFYDFNQVLVLGRVTTGPGGEILTQTAGEVLETEFPELAARIKFHQPDETEKRHGQAIAAASLPELKPKES